MDTLIAFPEELTHFPKLFPLISRHNIWTYFDNSAILFHGENLCMLLLKKTAPQIMKKEKNNYEIRKFKDFGVQKPC